MPVCRCGRRIQSGQLCSSCELELMGPQTDTTEYDCPECGGVTSGEGYRCADCRRGA